MVAESCILQPGIPPGDVIFALRVAPHESFIRQGQDLLAHVRITLSEALLGFSRVVLTHLDGRGIRVASPAGKIVRPDDAIVVRGEGMPARSFGAPGASAATRGDLFVVFEVEMPDAEWLKTVDTKTLEALLPAKKPPMVPPPAVIDDVRYEPTDIAAVSVGLTRSVLSSEANGGLQFGEADEDGWEDTDDEEEDDDLHDHIHGQPECQQQ